MNKLAFRIIALLAFLVCGMTTQAQLKAHGCFEADLFGKTQYRLDLGYEQWYGADFLYQYNMKKSQCIAKGGLAFDFGRVHHRTYNWNIPNLYFIEASLPLMMEFLTCTNTTKNGGFLGIGAVPTFYANVKNSDGSVNAPEKEKEKGWYIAPRMEIGAYVPVKSKKIRFSILGMYNINLSKENADKIMYKTYMSRAMFGASMGMLF